MCRKRKWPNLFGQFVGARQQQRRNGRSERLRGHQMLEVEKSAAALASKQKEA
jgi:hypothetical protein